MSLISIARYQTRSLGLAVFGMLSLAFSHPATALNYTFVDLGTLVGPAGFSYAYGVGSNGQVVGQSQTAGSTSHAFLWDSTNGMQDLVSLAGPSAFSTASGINNAGQVVGQSETASNPSHAFLWDSANGMQDLGSLIGPSGLSAAYAINIAGQAVGYSETAGGGFHAFLWDSTNGMQDLGSLTGPSGTSTAYGINAAGQVVGQSQTADGSYHAFVWDSVHGMQDLGALTAPGGFSTAYGINDAGKVVGDSQGADGNDHAFAWDSANGMQDLGPLAAPGGNSAARAIDNTGRIVGNAQSPGGPIHAFLLIPVSADTSAPTTTATLSGLLGNNNWYTGPVQVTLSAADPDGPSDVAATYYTLDGGATQTYAGPFMVSGDAVHALSFWSVDVAGNTEAAHSQSISIDGTAPTITVSPDRSTLRPGRHKMVRVTVSGRITDSLSGVAPDSAAFSVVDDCGEVQPSGPVTVQADGSYSFTVLLEARLEPHHRHMRRYTITVSADDLAGNHGSASTTVTVSRHHHEDEHDDE